MLEQEKRDPLELINERFAQLQSAATEEPAEKKKLFSGKKVFLLIFMVAILLGAAAAVMYILPELRDRNSLNGAAGSAKRASVTGNYRGILTSEEIEEWNNTKVQKGKVYIKVKTEIQVEERRLAYLRLINPPYCEYDCRFTIKEKESGEILYESETISPGNVVESVSLSHKIEYGSTEASIIYSFYAQGEEKAAGTKVIDVVLETAK